MKHPHAVALLGCIALLSAAVPASCKPDLSQITVSVGRLLEQAHYTHRAIDDSLSGDLLRRYLDRLDYNHLFFTGADIERLTQAHATSLDEDIWMGNLESAYAIFDLFQQRVEERLMKIEKLLENPDAIRPTREWVELSRQKAPWPKDMAEADDLWLNRVAADLLAERMNKHPIDPPVKVVSRRYQRFLRSLREQGREDQAKTFLATLAMVYDPHSDYMSRSDHESFQITMRLSLVGIGAMLGSEDGYAKIIDLVPGGPADRDGRLQPKDRIAAVAQAEGEFVDAVDMKLDKVVEMIRGTKGTTVRLQVIPAKAADPSERTIIQLVRDNIVLKDQEARAEVIEGKNARGETERLGWLTLPSFYADLEHPNAAGSKSTTRDVRRLLERLKRENIAGLVIDLSRNGGGSLDEAVRLTGLFIDRGYVVQVKASDGTIKMSEDTDPECVYGGPLVVLTSRNSASASEIFAGALQDYGRAVIVGDKHTFGKGTVQTIFELGRGMSFLGWRSDEAGALKFTIQKFYRVSGGSTQFNGVESDIVLPSTSDYEDFGERSLQHALPYDSVAPLPYERVGDLAAIVDGLRRASKARVGKDPEFRYIEEDVARVRQRLQENRISLDEAARRAELAADEARKKRREEEREAHSRVEPPSYLITLDDVDEPGLKLKPPPKKGKDVAVKDDGNGDAEEEDDDRVFGRPDRPEVDPIKGEALAILRDLVVSLRTKGAATARVDPTQPAGAGAPR